METLSILKVGITLHNHCLNHIRQIECMALVVHALLSQKTAQNGILCITPIQTRKKDREEESLECNNLIGTQSLECLYLVIQSHSTKFSHHQVENVIMADWEW